MNLGILLPQSKVYPSIGKDFLGGCTTYLKNKGRSGDVNVFTETIGFGGDEREVYQKAEKLLLRQDADVLVAYVDLKIKPLLEPLIYSMGKLAIFIHPGANYPSNWVEQPNIVHLTLQHSFLCWCTGARADGGGVMASSFYDCGYLHTAAMVKNFVQHGGAIRYNYINNTPYQDYQIQPLLDFLSADPTRNLLCVLDTHPASLFYAHLRQWPHSKELRLFVSPMMLQQEAFSQRGKGLPFPLEGYLSWSPFLANPENEAFMGTIRTETGKEATIFSLLGWEMAMVIEGLLSSAAGDFTDGEALCTGLKSRAWQGPRGKFGLDPDTQYFTAPLYRARLEPGSTELTLTEENGAEPWQDFTSQTVDGVSSGWTNTYLCY